MDQSMEYIMQMISFGGEGKSLVLQALHHAEEEQFAASLEKLQMARDSINKGRLAHANMLTYEANHQDDFRVSMLILHGADYVSNAEDMLELANVLVRIMKKEKGER